VFKFFILREKQSLKSFYIFFKSPLIYVTLNSQLFFFVLTIAFLYPSDVLNNLHSITHFTNTNLDVKILVQVFSSISFSARLQ